MQQPAGRRDEKARDDAIGEEVAALNDPPQPEEAACGDRSRYRQAPSPPVRHQKGEGDEREAERGMAGAERAVPVALARRNEGRGELLVAAKLDDLRRPGAPPMLLEDAIDQEAGAESEGEGEIDRRPGVAAEQRPPAEIMASGGRDGKQRESPGDEGCATEEEAYRRRIGEKEAAARAIEQEAEPQIDLRQRHEQQHRRAAGEEEDALPAHPVRRDGVSRPRRRRISAAARAVSFGTS